MMVLPVIVAALTASIGLRPEELPCVVLVTPRGRICVEVASTSQTRARGLAGRERLDVDGLLLGWHSAGRHPIWMAGMKFSLDLVWFDAQGAVVGLATGVPPCRRRPCPLYEPLGTERSVAVLELRAGAARRYALALGVHIRQYLCLRTLGGADQRPLRRPTGFLPPG
jgi:uncharacterized membrane protein (UPF0127 family)